ncbi:DUF6268 family outer membrane beta-barrel protein [Rapidithrix thailandica]|uniref:DUF6268 family outer membrane beta-barrel protein n=1 Tax=Rapidithrix thailandica TaxID=413964 RepID=A0AAW9SFM1_9BACT
MKKALFSFIVLGMMLSLESTAQIQLKTTYIGTSKFKDEKDEYTGGKGEARIYQGGINIPVSMKLNEENRPTAWMVGLSGLYASLENTGTFEEALLSDIYNAQVAVSHLRPLNTKWSLLVSLGVGVYTDDLATMGADNLLGQGGVIFIRHLKPNLEIGGGAALSSIFGYPMIFPAFYFNWKTNGRFLAKISVMNTMELSVGMKLNKLFYLHLVGEMNGMMALVEKNGEDVIFSHRYTVFGLQPEIKLGNALSIPITVGVTGDRYAYYQEKSLKDFFNDDPQENPHFRFAPYASVALKYTFQKKPPQGQNLTK